MHPLWARSRILKLVRRPLAQMHQLRSRLLRSQVQAPLPVQRQMLPLQRLHLRRHP